MKDMKKMSNSLNEGAYNEMGNGLYSAVVKLPSNGTTIFTPLTTATVNPAGLGFFLAGFKAIAIAAVGIGAIAGIVALIRKLSGHGKSVKLRFKKLANTLARCQDDFTTKENGLDMKAVLPGIGAAWMDKLVAKIANRKKSVIAEKGAIGMFPFTNDYLAEIAEDYESAINAFNQVAVASEQKVEDVRGGYDSFFAAANSSRLNEGKEAVKSITEAVNLANLMTQSGQFVDGDGNKISVTKQSTREVCYAIINNFMSKYINAEELAKKVGVNVDALANSNESDIDKLKSAIQAYSSLNTGKVSAQYARVKERYDNMLKHYYAIGDNLIKNFVKFSHGNDEKHANLIASAQEKLQAMWDKQKSFYNDNFSHVMIEITSSEYYKKYINFILEKVIPVFKTGTIGDSDMNLDMFPKNDQIYIVHQTGNKNQNYAVVKIHDSNFKARKLSAEFLCAVREEDVNKDDFVWELVPGTKIDPKAFKDDNVKNRDIDFTKYAKWLSLDPHPLGKIPASIKKLLVGAAPIQLPVFTRTVNSNNNGTPINITQYLIGLPGPSGQGNNQAQAQPSNQNPTQSQGQGNSTPQNTGMFIPFSKKSELVEDGDDTKLSKILLISCGDVGISDVKDIKVYNTSDFTADALSQKAEKMGFKRADKKTTDTVIAETNDKKPNSEEKLDNIDKIEDVINSSGSTENNDENNDEVNNRINGPAGDEFCSVVKELVDKKEGWSGYKHDGVDVTVELSKETETPSDGNKNSQGEQPETPAPDGGKNNQASAGDETPQDTQDKTNNDKNDETPAKSSANNKKTESLNEDGESDTVSSDNVENKENNGTNSDNSINVTSSNNTATQQPRDSNTGASKNDNTENQQPQKRVAKLTFKKIKIHTSGDNKDVPFDVILTDMGEYGDGKANTPKLTIGVNGDGIEPIELKSANAADVKNGLIELVKKISGEGNTFTCESFTVRYSITKSMNESYVTRHFCGSLRHPERVYVLSECIKSNSVVDVNRLANRANRCAKTFRTYDDLCEYAKNNENVSLSKFSRLSTFKRDSGVFESLVVFEISNDKIIGRKNIGIKFFN